MSGIVGQAGSKSGVIGETEIDYETGEWTPSGDTWTLAGTVFKGTYTKIGNLVIAEVMFESVTTNSGGSVTNRLNGLPFTCGAVRGNLTIINHWKCFSSNYGVVGGIVTQGTSYLNWLYYNASDNASGANIVSSGVGDLHMNFTAIYRT